MKKRLLSTVLALTMVLAMLSTGLFSISASAAIWYNYNSLCGPFVAGEVFIASSDWDQGYWQSRDRSIVDEYRTGPNDGNTQRQARFITKKAGVTELYINNSNSFNKDKLVIEVLKPVADVPVDTEYTVTGSKGTEHKWSIHSPNKNDGKRDDQRGLATLSSSKDNYATVMVTSVGNIIVDHQYIPDGSKDVKTEYIALKGVKGTPKCTVPEVVETVDGQILEYISLPQPDDNGVWKWDESKNPLSTEISVNGTNKAFAKFVPKNTKDYNEYSVEVSFVIEVAQDEESVPDEIKYFTYDKSAGALKAATIKSEDVELFTSSDDAMTIGDLGETKWYYAFGNIICNAKVTFVGDVRLILADESSTIFTRGIKASADSSLTIYSSSTGDKQGIFTVTTPNGANGKHNFENGGWASSGSSAETTAELGSLTINGGIIEFLPGSGGYGGLGGDYRPEGQRYSCSSVGGDGGAGGSALILQNLTINGGSLRAIGGNGGNGGNGQNVRFAGYGGNGGWGVNIKDGGAFNINLADDYSGRIYIASGKGGAGGKMWDRPDGESPAAVNVAINFSNKALSIFSSDDEITVDENGAISGTKLAADKLDEVTKHRFLLVNKDASDGNNAAAKDSKDKADAATGTMKSGGNPVIFIIIGVVIIAGVIAFVVVRKNKAPKVEEPKEEVEEKTEE